MNQMTSVISEHQDADLTFCIRLTGGHAFQTMIATLTDVSIPENSEIVTSQPSCCWLKLSRNESHSLGGISTSPPSDLAAYSACAASQIFSPAFWADHRFCTLHDPTFPCVKAEQTLRYSQQSLHRKRIGLRELTCFPLRYSFQRFDGSRFVNMNHCVKLIREPSLKVMTDSLRFRQVNNSNRTFEHLLV